VVSTGSEVVFALGRIANSHECLFVETFFHDIYKGITQKWSQINSRTSTNDKTALLLRALI